MNKIYLIDAIGPFVLSESQEATVNWSKVPFSAVEPHGRLSLAARERIEKRFLAYVERVGKLGYNSMSIDDLAHLTVFPWYSPSLKLLLGDYQELYRRLCKLAARHGIKIFINTDYLFFNDEIEAHLRQTHTSPSQFIAQTVQRAFRDFPEIGGIIMRLGETDGTDVRDTFLSRLTVRTPAHLNTLLKEVLPIFEAADKLVVVRTWTVGAYEIGDLIWNPKTYTAAFGSIKSSALIISMKFGDTDFTRYLSLNPLLLRNDHAKIVEFQTRREWEGMGQFPSFTGWEYASYLEQLKDNASIIGLHVWCQTGGWAKPAWNTLTYFDKKSFWVELNTEIIIAVARYGASVEDAIKKFCSTRGIHDLRRFTELLRLSEIAILKGIYIPDLARKTLYLRRTRIPPLLWIAWDSVRLSAADILIYRTLLPAKNTLLQDADQATEAAARMVDIAREIQLDTTVVRSLEFESATLLLFHELKAYIMSGQTPSDLNHRISHYQAQWPEHYDIPQLQPQNTLHKLPRWMLKVLLREKASYRRFDIFLLKTSFLQLVVVRLVLWLTKSRLATQAMGIQSLFK